MGWLVGAVAAVVLLIVGLTVIILSTQDSNEQQNGGAVGLPSGNTTTLSPEATGGNHDEDGDRDNDQEGVLPETGDPSEGSGGAAVVPFPTGVPYSSRDSIAVGECGDFMSTSEGTGSTGLFRADCTDASVVLEQIVHTENCPLERYAAYKRADGLYCFRWLLDVGDCISGQKWNRTPCSLNIPDPSILKVIETHPGETDGSLCERSGHFLQWGTLDNRGIACVMPLHQLEGSGEGAPASTG